MQATSRTLKLEDYDEITLNDDVDGNRVRREATRNRNVNENRGDNDDDIDSTTTIESSTIPVKLQEQEQSESNFVTMTPPPFSQQNEYNHFPYPPSANPLAQYVSITNSPQHQSYLPPVKNYYDFYPSQLDYHRNNYMMHYCINPIHHKFTPVIHDAWSNYHKWK